MENDNKSGVADKGANNITDILVEPANNSAMEKKDIHVGEISGVRVVSDVNAKDSRIPVPEYLSQQYAANH